MPDGQVVFEISADGKKAIASINDVTNAIEQAGKKWDSAAGQSTQNIESVFTGMLKKVGAAFSAAKIGQALLDFGKESVALASDLQEVQNVVDVTFGDGASQIESWAKSAQSQFGLTEIQAKRFTSTLGAMMKSSGLAGPEIVNMSTDLAGLAADMASFYNLDFDTAFQKIRSGISGETEPLKQLGINMSVANLEAYAMTQGITKAFDQMSQGEQTMLRYQYLMQATADAQGDFARTADGYANSQRRIQTAIDSIKTSAGTLLMGFVEPITSGLADMLTSLTNVPERTVMDEFADIDLKTAEKLAEIEKTADNARALIGVLDELQNTQVTNQSVSGWLGTLSDKLGGLDGAITAAKSGDYAGTLSGIASAMELKTGVSSDKWSTLLTAISSNLPAATNAADSDDQKTAKWLAAAGEAAAKLGGEYPGMWEEFMSVLGSADTSNALSYMANGQAAADALKNLGLNAKNLDDGEGNKWLTFLSALATADVTKGVFGSDAKTAAGNIKTLSDALNSNDPSERQQAWASMLGTLSANADGVSKLTGMDVDSTKKWLEDLAEAANTLDAGDTEGWQTLFTALKEGFTGLNLEGDGAQIFAQLAQGFAKLGNQSGQAEAALNALGIDTSNVKDKQELWLKTCKELVKTIPGLSDLINVETGEIKGGIPAIQQYVTEYEQANKKLIAMQALREKEQALAAKRVEMADYWLEAKRAEKARDLWEQTKSWQATGVAPSEEEQKKYEQLLKTVEDTTDEYNRQAEALKQAEEDYKLYQQVVNEMPGDIEKVTESTEQAAEANQELARSEKEVQDAYKSATSALEEVQKYYQKTVDSVRSTLQGLGGAFGAIETPAQQAQKNIKDLQDQLAKAKKDSEKDSIKLKLEGAGEAIQSITKMQAALDQQLSYFQNYSKMLERARELGYSDEVLSSVSDGSAQSYDYLTALTDSSITKDDERIKQLNESYQAVAAEREKLSGQLADQQLKTDQAFQGLVDSATEAINNLNLDEEASNAMAATVQGIANGIQSKIGAVQAQVNALNKVLSQIGSTGKFGFVNNRLSFGGFNFKLDGVHASGIDYIPFNNYLAALHEGESVLTAEEAKIWRNFKYGGSGVRNTIDYDALGASVGANVKGGGNVYLDGQTVGRVISARQADSFRAMERSGFQQ